MILPEETASSSSESGSVKTNFKKKKVGVYNYDFTSLFHSYIFVHITLNFMLSVRRVAKSKKCKEKMIRGQIREKKKCNQFNGEKESDGLQVEFKKAKRKKINAKK